jgi:hypothetical protein
MVHGSWSALTTKLVVPIDNLICAVCSAFQYFHVGHKRCLAAGMLYGGSE